MDLQTEFEALAEAGDFSGVFAISRDGQRLVGLARGFADRPNARPNTLATRFGLASVAKGFTALTAASLIETGELALDTTVRSLLPDQVPDVDPAVTIEHLLAHTSGIGDYLDENVERDIDDYAVDEAVHRLDEPMHYLGILTGYPQRSVPGEQWAYNNGAFVLLSIVIEAASGRSYYDLMQERVLDPAGLTETGFERSDRLPGGAAIGYLEDGRTNILHLPVRGAGDGGIYSTVADLERFWAALLAGRILPLAAVERLVAPRNDVPEEESRYGLGFWLAPVRDTVRLVGYDAGVSAETGVDRPSGITYTVISNTSSGAWPLVRKVKAVMPELADATTGAA